MAYTYLADFDILTCANCGIHFGISTAFILSLKNSHNDFYCPKGHKNYFPQKTKEEMLRGVLNQTNVKLERSKACCKENRNSLISTKGVVTKLKKKLQAVGGGNG